MQRTSTWWGLIKIKWFRGLERVESELRELKSEGELDDENSEAHPPPFYTRLCLCIETGTRPAAGIPLWCYGHRHCIVLPTSCGGRDGHQRSEAPIVISRNAACRTSLSSVCSYRIDHISLPPIIYAQLLAFWCSARQSGFSAVESHFRPRRIDLVALSWHQTRTSTGAPVLKIHCRRSRCTPDNSMENKFLGRRRDIRSGGTI